MQVTKGFLFIALTALIANAVASEQWSATYDSLFGTDTSPKSPAEARKLLIDLMKIMRTEPLPDDKKHEIKFWLNLSKEPEPSMCSGSLDRSLEQRSKGHPGLEEYAKELRDGIFEFCTGDFGVTGFYKVYLMDWSEDDTTLKFLEGVELDKPMSEELWVNNVYALFDDSSTVWLKESLFDMDDSRPANLNRYLERYRIRSPCRENRFQILVTGDRGSFKRYTAPPTTLSNKEFWDYILRPDIWPRLDNRKKMVFKKVRKCLKINDLESDKLHERVFNRLYERAKAPIKRPEPKVPEHKHFWEKFLTNKGL